MEKTGDDDYWSQYNNLQRVKHAIVRNYLNGWLPKLTLGQTANSRILYFDTHAGRGTHLNGELGSPILALNTVLNHRAFPQLSNAELQFVFIERDADNLAALQGEIAKLGELPQNVKYECAEADSFKYLQEIVDTLKRAGKRLAPSFVFCDPFGFKIPGSLLKDLMQFRSVEIFINIIWRELDMAIAQGKNGVQGMVALLDSIFNGHDWRSIDAEDFDDRAEQCAQLFRKMVGATWGTYIKMLGGNGRTRYFLLHLTNNDAGRVLMKECIWKSCPDGGYYARQKDDPAQQLLIKPEPDYDPIEAWVIARLGEKPRGWKELTELTKEELWLGKHTNTVVNKLKKEGIIQYSGCGGKRFAEKNNPLLTLSK